MSVADIIHFDKDGEVEPGGVRNLIFRRLFLAILIILVATLSFGIGRLTAPSGEDNRVRLELD